MLAGLNDMRTRRTSRNRTLPDRLPDVQSSTSPRRRNSLGAPSSEGR